MTTDWNDTDIRAAEARLAEAQAEVTRLKGKLADQQAAKDAAGVGGPALSAAEEGKAEARRRIALRQAPEAARSAATDAQADNDADDVPPSSSWADGIAAARARHPKA
jgi:multidrug resistance efflux pump